jgi:NAD(P)-dependent dehydrogenase (short-subunit alcohol dehydrogenase family)
MAKRERGKVVVITGASAGVGRATAHSFAKRGWSVGLIARGKERLEAARREVDQLGGKGLVLRCDVGNFDEVEAAAARAEAELGPIDVWINNAMATVFSRFEEYTAEEYRRVTEVTYLGTVHGTMAALRRMKARNRGVIVQSGSALAYRAIPLQSGYCGAKHAIRGFTDSIRCELLHDNVNVHITMVQFPALNTPQFEWNRAKLPNHPQPVPPIYQPEVAAEALYFASRHRRREVNVGFNTEIIIAGNKVLPGVGDWYLARNGFESQQTDQPVKKDRADNLFQPAPGDFGAHGTFDAIAKDRCLQLWITTHRRTSAIILLAVLLLIVILLLMIF